MKKYDAVTRKRVWGEIERLMNLGFSSPNIGEQLRGMGFKMPDGKTDITDNAVSKYMYYLDRKANAPGVTVSPPPQSALKSDRLPSAIVGILTAPTLNAEQKVRMCIAFAEL